MITFKDNQGKQWTICLTLGKVRRLRESLGLDLLNPTHYMQILNSLTDRLAFVFLLVQEQAEKEGLDADGFEDRLQGENIAHDASKAFLEETELFFQKLGQKGLKALAKNAIEAMDAGRDRLSDLTESGDFDSMIRKMTGLDKAPAESGSPSPS